MDDLVLKSFVLKNVDVELLKKQKQLLIDLVCGMDATDSTTQPVQDALNGIINLLDRITDGDEDNKALKDKDVDKVVSELKVLLAFCSYSDMSTKAQDKALATTIRFLECRPPFFHPVRRRRND